jgi:hypothetical protein
MQHEFAEAYFNEAVDPEALGIPDYFDIIKVRTAAHRQRMALSVLLQHKRVLNHESRLREHQ